MSSTTALVELARDARVASEADYGSERQISAFNTFLAACKDARPLIFGDDGTFERRIDKATSNEIIDIALELLDIPPHRRPW